MEARARTIRAGAVLYTAGTAHRSVLSEFAAELKSRGWRLGGVVQKTLYDADGTRRGIDAVEVDTGRRIPISRPTKHDLAAGTCTLDRSALAEATNAVRRAVEEGMDLVVVDKFGEREQEGDGLADEILEAIAEGVPTLVSVPAAALERWIRFTGGMGDLVAPDMEALWRWWGPHNLYRELALGVAEGPVKRVVIGLNWTLVEGTDGCGLAQSPARGARGCGAGLEAGALAGGSLRELARFAESWNPLEAAVGIAAINAHANRYDLTGSADNGLDVFAALDGPITVVGRFPGVGDHLPRARVVERSPEAGEFPEQAAGWLIPASEAAVITAATLADHSLPGLLRAGRGTRIALVGPSTPLTPRLFAYGVEVLAGLVVEDPETLAGVVAAGGTVGALKHHARHVTLRKGAL
jgi:uncharacterized protein (DUF4213/DUF364 family)/nucleoside-triphosphatase THEP1